jgi:hypothetical protein
MLLVSGCNSSPASEEPVPSGQAVGPYDEAATLRPDLMKLEPAKASAGETVEVFYPRETHRGIHFVLEVQDSESWDLMYNLLSDWGEGKTPEVYRIGELFSYPDVGIGGPGPDKLVIPDDAPPGAYRICTGNAGTNFCAGLTIEAS